MGWNTIPGMEYSLNFSNSWRNWLWNENVKAVAYGEDSG